MSEEPSSSWAEFFRFLRESLPGWLAFFGIGLKIGQAEKKAVEIENSKLRLEKELLENRETVRSGNDGKSSVDVVGDIPGVGPPSSNSDSDPADGG